jgi:hypothetical protein
MPKLERDTASSTSDSHIFSRRDFVARTSLIGAGLVVGPLLWTGCSDQSAEVRSTTGTRSARGSNKMKTRQLGKLMVSEIGAGAMSISANYGPPADRSEGIKVLREAHQRGVTFFDTAEVYGPYTNEELVGEALAPVRNSVRIATKFGFDIEGGTGGLNSRPDTSRQSSMARSSVSAPTVSIFCTSIASIRTSRSRTSRARSKS